MSAHFWLLLFILVATSLDHVTTNVFLKRRVAREGNAFLAWVLRMWGTTGLYLVKLAMWGGLVFTHYNVAHLPLWLLAGTGLVFLCVAVYNLYVIDKGGL